MSATGEIEKVTVEHPTVEKPIKEKKAKAPKEKKPKAAKTSSHPPYFEMIKEALLALNEKGGSRPYAIAKYIEEKLEAVLPANFRKILGLQLKNSAVKGKLIKVKASYRLSEAGKKDMVATKAVKTVAEKKPKQSKVTVASKVKATKKIEVAKKTKKPVKKVGVRKTKKSAPVKPKQPKSIKYPAAKRTRKAAA